MALSVRERKLLTAALLGSVCAFAVARASQPPAADFSGIWSVDWCSPDSTLECGGFKLALTQDGERLCGDFAGALVNLRQVDEGKVMGTVVGNTAVLAVESDRNGSIALARATHNHATLQWHVVGSIRAPENNDIAVIAYDSELTRQPPSTSKPVVQADCFKPVPNEEPSN